MDHSGPGRPQELDLRQVVNAILYIVRTGCQWANLPKESPITTASTSITANGAKMVLGDISILRCESGTANGKVALLIRAQG
jgi:transposase